MAKTLVAFIAAFAVVAGPLNGVARADESCTQPGFNAGARWAGGGYTYALKGSSFPRISGSIDAAIRGRHVWNNTTNTCGYSDVTNFTARNQTHEANIGFSAGDGYNRIDFGSTNFPGCDNAVACTFTLVRGGTTIIEMDTRFVNQPIWATDGNPNYVDIWAVASHEAGHALGLNHGGGNWQTMYGGEPAVGELRKRALGCGDVRGLRSLYGGALPSC